MIWLHTSYCILKTTYIHNWQINRTDFLCTKIKRKNVETGKFETTKMAVQKLTNLLGESHHEQ